MIKLAPARGQPTISPAGHAHPLAMHTLSYIVPCLNEQDALPVALPRLLDAGRANGGSFEILLVDDGSTDRTWELILAASAAEPAVRGIRFSDTFGQHAAMLAGLEHARGDFALLVDADLQDPPELAVPMLAEARAGKDIVYGVRRSRAGERWLKRASAWMFHRMLHVMTRRSIPVDSGYFCLLSRRAVDALLSMPGRDRHFQILLNELSLPRAPFPYDRAPRIAGKTKYSWIRLLRVAIHAFTSALRRPTRKGARKPVLFEIRETTP